MRGAIFQYEKTKGVVGSGNRCATAEQARALLAERAELRLARRFNGQNENGTPFSDRVLQSPLEDKFSRW